MQDKRNEVAFFDAHAAADDYNVFSDSANARLIDGFVRLSCLPPGARVIDLGCGSGTFTYLLKQRGYAATGLDISPKLLELARRKYPDLQFDEGDVEALPYEEASVDGVLLSGIVHHLPDPSLCAAEVMRVLRPGGRFVAFDPNRANPFMYLYRDRSSPLYNSVGVTVNERPIRAREVAETFRAAGLEVRTDYLSKLPYRYVASRMARVGLSIYHFIDNWMSRPDFMKPYSAFVLTYGEKP
jgi:ubiquinone/menaquinone biosynthesis C-methylase UbiE